MKSAVTPRKNACGQSFGIVIGNVRCSPGFIPMIPSIKPGRFTLAAPVSRLNFFCLIPSMGVLVSALTASRSMTAWSPISSPRSTTTRIVPSPRSRVLKMASASSASVSSSPGEVTVTDSLR